MKTGTLALRGRQVLGVSGDTQPSAGRILVIPLVAALASIQPAPVLATTLGAATCGPLHHNYGPFDYRTDRARLPIVENYHFTPEIEGLIRGKSDSLEGEINYTLHAFPNHHRALVALVKLGERRETQQPGKLPYPIECYFERALRFQPDDTVARMLYADYLVRQRRPDDARTQLQRVAVEASDNAFTHYNLGLLFLKIGDNESALGHAHRAETLGLARTELADQLKAKGAWRDATPAPPAAASAP